MLMFFTTASKARQAIAEITADLKASFRLVLEFGLKSTALIRYEVCLVVATSFFISTDS